MRRVLALVFVVAVLLPTVFVSAAGAEPGKNPPNGLARRRIRRPPSRWEPRLPTAVLPTDGLWGTENGA